MRRVLVNYADGNAIYKEAQITNAKSALKHDIVDEVFLHNRNNIELGFYNKNQFTLDRPRGVGYWLWKPYIVGRMLQYLQDDDCVFYSDVRAEFIKSAKPLYALNEESTSGITAFQLNSPCTETRNTKGYTFEKMGCTDPYYWTGENELQNLASFFLIRKNKFSMQFMKEWLEYSQDYNCISDTPSDNNFEGFMDHRHDQSIFSLLLKKHKIQTYIDPSQYGNDRRPQKYYYDQFILHTR